MKALEPQKMGVDMQAPETPVAKKKRKSKKKAEEEKVEEEQVENPTIDKVEGEFEEPATGFEEE